MIQKSISLLRDGVGYTRRHPELLFTFFLVLVIPVAFVVSGQQFLKASRDNQERLEKDRIGLMHDIFVSFLLAADFDPETIQKEIEYLASRNGDITKFRVVAETDDGFIAIAALDENVRGIVDPNPAYRIAQTRMDESIITPYTEDGVRYWQSFRLVQSDDGDEFYIFTETSLEGIDALFASRIRMAYVWLIGLLVIVLLLVLRHIRLIDYAYLYAETKRANEMKDLFTNMIAHELRAPLTAMRGYASMIRENASLHESVREQAGRIEDSAERLVLIVSDLLDVARIKSGKLAVKSEEYDVAKTVVEVVEAQRPSAFSKHIELVTEGTGSAMRIMGDEKRFFQALTNLVSNAIKYTPKGSIKVSIEGKSDRVELRVKDTGMGIDAKSQKELFAPFFRVASDDMSKITGTGLGMWITKQITELMGGSIGVESIKGIGTHIVITLPRS